MTIDDIARIAREAKFIVVNTPPKIDVYWQNFEKFVDLVAASEREKVARWQIGSGYTTGHGETIEDLLVELEWQVRESEREACARVAESYEPRCDTCPSGVSNAIRARRER